MTTAEKLASLEAQIRKDIPRLMEFKEGFIIENNNTQVKLLSSNYEFDKECIVHLFVNTEIFWYLTDEDLKHSKIIGHDIMLNDVLEWLNVINELNTSVFLRKETFEFQRINEDNKLFIVGWNLSTPYLKDQSEELIKFLHNLIKE